MALIALSPDGARRTATCRFRGCNRTYTQVQLQAEFMRAHPELEAQFPGGWTPDYCPKHARELNEAEYRDELARGRVQFEALFEEIVRGLSHPNQRKARLNRARIVSAMAAASHLGPCTFEPRGGAEGFWAEMGKCTSVEVEAPVVPESDR